ncbi:calcium/sodium antiporter [Ruania suaedae]|uniref:calcium/sodium antiporter n=1 Tax=Ruania suaedae TaxID=2897774 RepID=UPI001E28DB73|nr:calcium/sodium antiporter [Ruania suaedae]UFU03248.1 calcium/sodium antiporter [Ruania suaedae]
MTVTSLLLLAGGFVLLVAGGEALVRGAGSLARTLGMSPLLVGLTVVSFATSTPELAVSAQAALGGAPGLAVGNVVGSNIANVLLILGASALVAPLVVRSQLVRADIPVMISLAVLALLLALDGTVTRIDGLLLVGLLMIYLVALVTISRRAGSAVPVADEPEKAGRWPALRATRARSLVTDLVLVAAGVAMLVGGAQLLVGGAREIASGLGVSDLVIGLTVVAIGTSLPELATSVIAVVRGEREMAVGNIVGSNIFNIGAVLGLTAVLAPEGVQVGGAALNFDLPVMIAAMLVLLPIAFTRQSITRWEGGLLVALYLAYVTYLVLASAEHDALGPFSTAMLWFVLPITALWLIVLASYEIGLLRGRRERSPGS